MSTNIEDDLKINLKVRFSEKWFKFIWNIFSMNHIENMLAEDFPSYFLFLWNECEKMLTAERIILCVVKHISNDITK